MNRTKINWGIPNLYTWNPILGCKRGCKWGKSVCYAEGIYNRFFKKTIGGGKPFSEIQVIGHRFNDPGFESLKPRTIFVGSMSDIDYWDDQAIRETIAIFLQYERHTGMFLSKNPMSYLGYRWPANTMQGLTMTCTQTINNQMDMLLKMQKYPRPYLSLEPLLGKLKVEIGEKFERVIVGAATRNGKVFISPEKEWIESIIENVPPEKVFWKDSISYNFRQELAEQIIKKDKVDNNPGCSKHPECEHAEPIEEDRNER